MTELEKLEAGLEYCYDDPEVDGRKEQAIIMCQRYNALDPLSAIARRKHMAFAKPVEIGRVHLNGVVSRLRV